MRLSRRKTLEVFGILAGVLVPFSVALLVFMKLFKLPFLEGIAFLALPALVCTVAALSGYLFASSRESRDGEGEVGLDISKSDIIRFSAEACAIVVLAVLVPILVVRGNTILAIVDLVAISVWSVALIRRYRRLVVPMP